MGALWRPGALRALILGGSEQCPAEFWKPSETCFGCFLLPLLMMDASARATMEGAAKWHKHCELQNSVNQQNPELILRLRAIPGSMLASESPLHPAPGTLLHNAFIDAVTALLHCLALFFLPFWCGGLCTAHGIKSLASSCSKFTANNASTWFH